MIWTNTSLFDSLLPKELVTTTPSKATSIILGAPPIDIKLFPNVKFVFRAGVGTDNVNFSSDIQVEFPSVKTKNYIYEETANFTCSLIFKMLYDGIGDLTSWSSTQRHVLTNKTLLIIGLGNIGQRVKHKMAPFIKNILTYDILNDDRPPDYSKADIVTLHIPYTPQNKNFINKENLKRFKSDAILINTARGPLVNEDDLYHHLKITNMRAAFDAFWEEPYTGKLTEFKSDKFFMTPHIASSSIEFIEGCYEDFKSHHVQIAGAARHLTDKTPELDKAIEYTAGSYTNFLKGKKVIIIGPAQYVTTKPFYGFGEKIDKEFDVVVRLNRGLDVIDKYKPYIGSKTDVFYNCLIEHKDNGGIIDINRLKDHNIQWVCTIPHSDIKGNCHNNRLSPMVNLQTVSKIANNFNFHVMDYRLYGELNKGVACRANTGFAAIFDLLNRDVESLYVTGFSFYLDNFTPGYKEGCTRDEEEFAKQCFASKRHNQVNQWEYSRKHLKDNPKVILDDVLTKILNLKTLSREEFNEKTQDLYSNV